MLFWSDHNADIDLHAVLQVFKFTSLQSTFENTKKKKNPKHTVQFLVLIFNHFSQPTKSSQQDFPQIFTKIEEQIRTHNPHPIEYAFSCQTSFICLYIHMAKK